MFDFTLTSYRALIGSLIKQDFSFQTFEDFIIKPERKIIILRQDVDKLPANSLIFAKIQQEMKIRGTYYFRVVKESWDEGIIRQIAGMGHEIGYHYEDVSLAARRLKAEGGRRKEQEAGQESKKYVVRSKKYLKEDFEKYLVEIAIESFKENLAKLRAIAPVKTICMHGSPMSRWDSRLLWKYYDYRDFGIIGEPYFDVDFNEMLYLTDTGRRWDGEFFNIRDKAVGRRQKAEGKNEETLTFSPPPSAFRLKYHSTFDIIKAAEEGKLPDRIMMAFHPQRWTNRLVPWFKELVWQNVKNVGKYFLIRLKAEG